MGCVFNKKQDKNKDDKDDKDAKKNDKNKQKMNEVLEDIMDIKAVQIKGEMLFCQTIGNITEHYNVPPKVQENTGYSSPNCLYEVSNKFSGCIRSLKKVKRSIIDLQEDEKNFVKEIVLLRTVDHMAVLKIYEYYQDSDTIQLIMEHCIDDLFNKIQSEAPFNEYTACHVVYQILSALVYCHSNSVIHRDIKAESILIESEEYVNINNQNIKLMNIRLAGFGCGRYFSKKKKLTKKIGTSYYIAPEVLNRNYNEKCDIWSVGVLLYCLLVKAPPFWGENDKEIIKMVQEGNPEYRDNEWKDISPEGKKFVQTLLTVNPSNRPSASEALQNEWITKYMYKHPVSVEEVQDLYNNLITFKVDSKLFFQQAALAYMVHHVATKEDIKTISHFYRAIDENGDGKMEYSEIIDGFKKYINIDNEKAIMKIFKYIDQAHTGCIEYEEFIRACINKSKFLKESNLRKTFELLKKEKLVEEEVDGEIKIGEGQEIPVDEFKELLGLSSKFTDKQWELIIKEVDKNGDGQIEYEEFKEMMELFFKVEEDDNDNKNEVKIVDKTEEQKQ